MDPRLQRVTAAIMSGALAYSAVNVFDALTKLNTLKRQAELEMDKIDILLVPTAACHYTIAGGDHTSLLAVIDISALLLIVTKSFRQALHWGRIFCGAKS